MSDIVKGLKTGPAFVVTAPRVTEVGHGVGLLGMSICLGPASWGGVENAERHFQYGARRENVEGYVSPPCLALDFYGFWRFRWVVATGARSITVYTKQASNVAVRPSIKLKANSAAGLAVDTETFAGSSTGWIAMTVGFVATAPGRIWVELWNNCLGLPDPCFFDQLSVV